jgi:hypothetical protein
MRGEVTKEGLKLIVNKKGGVGRFKVAKMMYSSELENVCEGEVRGKAG